jgi:hypothetical protein
VVKRLGVASGALRGRFGGGCLRGMAGRAFHLCMLARQREVRVSVTER